MDKKRFKSYIMLLTYGILLFIIATNLEMITGSFGVIMAALSPFIIGFALAFLLNKPHQFIYNKALYFMDNNKSDKVKGLRKPLAVLFTYISLIIFILILSSFIIPQLIDSASILIEKLPVYSADLIVLVDEFINSINFNEDIIVQIQSFWIEIISYLSTFLSNIIPQIVSYLTSFASNIVNLIISVIVSIYLLSSKDELIKHVKIFMNAFFSEKIVKTSSYIVNISSNIFGDFVVGQLTDAVIVGFLCFIGMSILNMPYALLISVIIACTNVIPFFGPFIGAIPSIFILLMVDPTKALYFAIFMVVLQQVEGNIIYPRIVGDSIGIPGIWVLFAIMVGGSLFGFAGMILGVPTFAVIYRLISDKAKDNLDKKNISNIE